MSPTARNLLYAFFVLALPNIEAYAQDHVVLAEQLGQVLGSEQVCNLQYNHDAIQKFITTHFRADDPTVTGGLNELTNAAQYALSQMSPSDKAAHCAESERAARSYGFIE